MFVKHPGSFPRLRAASDAVQPAIRKVVARVGRLGRIGSKKRIGSAITMASLTAGAALLGALACSAALAGGGAVWHVRVDGSDTSCSGVADAADPGTGAIPRACAFASPQKAVDVAGIGDTVLLHAGTYTTAGTTVQGISAIFSLEDRVEFNAEPNRLTIKAAGDGTVVFDGGGTIDSGVVIWGTCYLTIEGITFRHFTADRNGLYTYGAAAVNIGSPGPGFSSIRNILRSLTIEESALNHATGPHAEIAIWCHDCTDNSILDSSIDSVFPAAIAVGSDGTSPVEQRGTITGNTIVHARDHQAWAGVLAVGTANWTFERNYLADPTTADASSDLLRVQSCQTWGIAKNVFFDPPHAAVALLDDQLASNPSEGHLVLNNTIECAGSGTIGVQSVRINASEIRNNLIEGCAQGVLFSRDSTATNLGFNGFHGVTTAYAQTDLPFGYNLVGHDLLADPQFTRTDPRPDPYYRLANTSPAIDAGDDQHCGANPPDTHCDLGAYQAIPPGALPPVTPSITSVDQITGNSALLHSSAFSDPDEGDMHAASRWQVDTIGGDFSAPVHDSGRTTSDLTAHRVRGLSSTTQYKSRVRHQDENGNWSDWSDPAADTAETFTTLGATAIAPKVVNVVPAAGATEVAVGVQPALTFNVPVDPATVTIHTVRLLRKGVPVPQAPGSPSVQGGGITVRIQPAGLLDPSAKYVIAVSGGASGVRSLDSSIAGKPSSSAFTTEGALQSSNPANGAQDVSIGVHPQLHFKWAVDAATATVSKLKLIDQSSGKKVALASVVTSGAIVTLTPAAPLASRHKFAVIVPAGAAGLRFADGRQLGKPVKVTFRTMGSTQ